MVFRSFVVCFTQGFLFYLSDGSGEIAGIDLSKLSGVKRSNSYEVSEANTNEDRTDSKKLRRRSVDNSKPSVFDFRVMGGEALIPISINERHGNHVYEDLILWNINGMLCFFVLPSIGIQYSSPFFFL